MSKDHCKLRAEVIAEPLSNYWYGWSYLIPPATHARYLTESQMPIIESFIDNPEAHVDALKNPEMAGGPFIQYGPERVPELQQLLNDTKADQQHLLLLSKSIEQLEAILDNHPKGASLEPLYQTIPTALRGFIELVYDARDCPSIRFIEGMIYRSDYYQTGCQGVGLRRVANVDRRPFVLSTPSLSEDLECYLRAPFQDPRFDRLFQARDVADSPEAIADTFQLQGKSRDVFLDLFTDDLAPDPSRFRGEGVRIRYLGHACVLIESSDVSILCDPLVSNPNPSGMDRYSYADLPDTIDYAMMTHNHQDHVMFETLLQLRHKIRNVVIPTGQKGSLLDPSLKMTLERVGFNNIIEIEELQSINVPNGEIVSLPVYGEHGDLNIATKNAYWVKLHGRSVICAADSNNVDTTLYKHLRHLLGSPDVLFIGMECEGAPYTWNYGPLLPQKVKRQQSESRRLDGSDSLRAMELVETMAPGEVYVYAMGMEPWLTYITSIIYNEASGPLLEANAFIEKCKAIGVPCERAFGAKEIHLSPITGETVNSGPLPIPEGADTYVAPTTAKPAQMERAVSSGDAIDPEMEKVSALLQELQSLNVKLWLEESELKCNAPKGVLTAELTSEIKHHKAAIVELVKQAGPTATQTE